MDIQLPIQLPTIDLSTVIPLLALVLLAALILAALTARTLIKSRAFTIALVAAVVILGSSTIVGSLQSVALLIGVAGVMAIGIVIVLGRNPDVLDLLHVAVKRDSTTAQFPPVVIEQRPLIDAPRSVVSSSTSRRETTVRSTRPPEGWGF